MKGAGPVTLFIENNKAQPRRKQSQLEEAVPLTCTSLKVMYIKDVCGAASVSSPFLLRLFFPLTLPSSDLAGETFVAFLRTMKMPSTRATMRNAATAPATAPAMLASAPESGSAGVAWLRSRLECSPALTPLASRGTRHRAVVRIRRKRSLSITMACECMNLCLCRRNLEILAL